MPTYRYLVGDLTPSSGNGIREEIPFSQVSYSHVLDRPGAFSATIGLRHPKATRANLDPGRTAVHVERDGVLAWSGILWAARAGVSGATLEVGGEGWWSYFRRRRLKATKIYGGVDQLAIARDLVGWAQAQPGGDIGVVVGAETSGVARDRTLWHYERKQIAEAVEQLAAVAGGFDFAVEVAYEAGLITKRLRLSYPRRGRVTPIRFELGANLEDLSAEVDATAQANNVDALGAGEGDAMLIATAADPGQLDAYPLLEDVEQYKDVSVAATLDGHASRGLAARKAPVMRLPVVVGHQPHPDAALGNYITGDTLTVVGRDGWVDVDALMRIMEINVSIDIDGRERVSLGLAEEDAAGA